MRTQRVTHTLNDAIRKHDDKISFTIGSKHAGALRFTSEIIVPKFLMDSCG